MQAEDINKYIRLVLLITISSCSNSNLTPDQLAQNALIIDTHIDTPIRLVAQKYQNIDLDDISGETDFDFDYPKAVAGGLNLPFFSIYVPARLEAEGTSFEFANETIDLMDNIIDSNSDYFFKVDTSIYLGNLPGQNLIGIAYGMENGSPLEGKLENVQYFHDKGIRYITLTHSLSNHISDSSYDENKQWGGLSPFGQALIKEMNNVGMMIDVSHVSDDAFYQTIDLSRTPVIASHSSLRYFTPDWERNMSDEMVKAIAENGGVVQINFGSNFLINDNRVKDDSEEYIFADVADVADHIDRVVSLTSIRHVGIGSDYDGVGDTLPTGLKNASTYPNLIQELQKRGYSTSDIQLILGGNLARVWREVEEYAK